MKKVFPVLFLSSLLMLAGCSNLFDSSADVKKTGGKACVSLSCESASRTIMPSDMSLGDTAKIVLSAKKLDENGEYKPYSFGEAEEKVWNASFADGKIIKSAYDSMAADSIELDFGTYSFLLDLYTGADDKARITQTGILSKEITADTTKLEFTTKYVENGELAIQFSWPCDEEGFSKIGMMEAGLFTLDSNGVESLKNGDTDYDFEELLDENDLANKKAIRYYKKSEVPSGTYYLKYRFYDVTKTVVLNTVISVIKINGFKTEREIEVTLDQINSLPNAAGQFFVDDSQIEITAEPQGDLYLNYGSVQIKAFKCGEGEPEDRKIAASQYSAKLFYGGNEVDFGYHFNNENGTLVIGAEYGKLLTGGTYQLYVTADATDFNATVAGSNVFDIEVLESEYILVDVDDESGNNWETQLEDDINNLSAPAIVKAVGTGTNTDTVNSTSGTVAIISEKIKTNKLYPVDLDLSELEGVSVIESSDISANKIASLVLPNGVTKIAARGININGKLASITLPESVSEIEPEAISCSYIGNVVLSDRNENYFINEDGSILYKKLDGDSLELFMVFKEFDTIDFSSTEYENVTQIASYAFKNAKIKEISGLGNLTEIADRAFCYATIESLKLDKLIDVADEVYPFYGSAVKNLTIDFEITEENFDKFEKFVVPLNNRGTYYNRNGVAGIENLVFNKYAYIKNNSTASSDPSTSNDRFSESLFYSSRSSLKSIKFVEGAHVDKYRFIALEKLEEVIFGAPPDSKESSLAGEVFSGYDNYNRTLVTLDLTGIKELPYRAFYRCTALTEVALPASLEDIKLDAFESCSALEKYNVAEGNTHFKSINEGTLLTNYDGDTLIMATSKVKNVDFTDTGIKTLPNRAFWSSSLNSVNLTGVEYIGDQAFYNMTGLTSVVWGNTVKSIGYSAFYRVPFTDGLDLPASVIAISSGAFERLNTENPINTFTIGGVSTTDSTQPTGWYKLTSETTWKEYIANKPASITTDDTIISLPESGATDKVLKTIMDAACSSSSSSYYYRLVD